MSNDKTVNKERLSGPGKAAFPPDEDVPMKTRPVVRPKVVSIEIDEDFDAGGDPYNHTGSHYVKRLRDDD